MGTVPDWLSCCLRHSHLISEGLGSALPQRSSQLPANAGDISGTWIPATHVGDQIEFLAHDWSSLAVGEVNQEVEGRSLLVSLCCSAFQRNKNN